MWSSRSGLEKESNRLTVSCSLQKIRKKKPPLQMLLKVVGLNVYRKCQQFKATLLLTLADAIAAMKFYAKEICCAIV